MKQYSTPVCVSDETTTLLSRVEPSPDGFDESWVQQLVFSHPETLPISEIEPAFGDAISVCREMATESGYCDIVLVNALGYVTVVECKLWKNPEGRRQVVAQTMDYAKDLSRMSYETFEKRCLDARGDRSESLFSLVQERYPDADQTTFIDGVQRNLNSARIMLLVVGDGIRENTVELTEFLERHATLRFTFGLVELPVYRLDDETVLVTPRVLAKWNSPENVDTMYTQK